MVVCELHKIRQCKDIAGLVSADEMASLYDDKMAKLGQPGRSTYDKLKLAPINGTRPICGQRKVTTLDHHLLKQKYPILAVTPINLIPCCSDCNKIKDDFSPDQNATETLHPYYDRLDDERWLFAEVQQNSPVSLRYFVNPPITWDAAHELFQRDDIELVINALPSYLHVPVTMEFLTKGFHVLCEKPLARRVKDVDALIEAAQKSGRILAVYQQSRFSPAFVRMREVIESGVLGRVVQVSIAFNGFARRWDWQTLTSMDGGNLLNTGPHPIDQALQLFGTDVMPQVWCRFDSANSYGDAEDYVKLIVHGDGRPTIDVEISSCDAHPMFTYHVQATHGGLAGDTTHLEWRYFRPEESVQRRVTKVPLQKEDGTPAYCSEQLTWHQEHWDVDTAQGKNLFFTMAQAYYSMLHNTLIQGDPLKVTPQEVRQQISVFEECLRQNPQFDV